MATLDQVKKTIEEFPARTSHPHELAKLQAFFDRMKQLGLVRTREYDLPLPDTIGRGLTNWRSNTR